MKRKARFLTKLLATDLPDGVNHRLYKPLKFLDQNGDLHVVPAGFVTDFASIPPLAYIAGVVMCFTVPALLWTAWFHLLNWMLLFNGITAFAIWVCIIAWHFNSNDKLDAPATIHDNGYRRRHLGSLGSQIRMKQYWDGILYQAMRANGVDLFTANTVWFMLLLFGWFAYFRKR
jgi:Protein of unknown function (DUF1353)